MRIAIAFLTILSLSYVQCQKPVNKQLESPSIIILGTVQDAGAPHIACQEDCCSERFQHHDPDLLAISLGLVDPENEVSAMIEASPDLTRQAHALSKWSNVTLPDAIFLTHAHIGHYTGLMYLGKEGKGADRVIVHAMPRMRQFLETNGPWSQLVSDSNILLNSIYNLDNERLSNNISLVPLLVPHRDEYSETVGYHIIGPNRQALFIPDIDKWDRWDQDIVEWIKKVDIALLDATFFSGDELGGRDMSTIPHPSIEESMELFSELPEDQRSKIHFIHLNHSNPALDPNSPERRQIESAGYRVAEIGDVHPL